MLKGASVPGVRVAAGGGEAAAAAASGTVWERVLRRCKGYLAGTYQWACWLLGWAYSVA